MENDEDRVHDGVLALLRLTLHDGQRVWKGFDWQALGRLHRKGMISDPVRKPESVALTGEGLRRSEELLAALFAKAPGALLVQPGRGFENAGEKACHRSGGMSPGRAG